MTEVSEFSAKIYAARSQLRTALWLFLEDMDPISVHALSCAGCEILAEITVTTNTPSMSKIVHEYASSQEPVLKIKDFRNADWNAFKHVLGFNASIRDDNERIENFDDSKNDALLYQGWFDLWVLDVALPVEAYIYRYWYAANYPEAVPPSELQISKTLFNFNAHTPRSERKAALVQCCTEWRSNDELKDSDRTDPLPLTAVLTAYQSSQP